ncbi:hypothetical protein [Actinomadura sp. 21ATH]|uniref:hypothetical protein n=1 Tax=Actinomadura sp. 21ATH TaxID=1735444 RepID=UPI0035BF48C1
MSGERSWTIDTEVGRIKVTEEPADASAPAALDWRAFITARLDERQEQAETVHDLGCGVIRRDGTCDCGEPARIRLEVAFLCEVLADHDENDGSCDACGNYDPSGLHDHREPFPCRTVRALAKLYASHPEHPDKLEGRG